jgi:hypothetical protein
MELTMAKQSKATSPKVASKAARKTSTSRRRKSGKQATARRSPARRPPPKRASKRWSQRITKESDALDLEHGVFKQTSARKIAASLKRSAERSRRRKSGAYRSALSMLTFYINRAGRNLPKSQKDRLQRAKVELKQLFAKE